ncbi:MAG: hypothetical protein ACT4OL_01140 [Nitrospiraceae bacterium]
MSPESRSLDLPLIGTLEGYDGAAAVRLKDLDPSLAAESIDTREDLSPSAAREERAEAC